VQIFLKNWAHVLAGCGNVASAVDPMLDISRELRGKAGEVMSGDNTLMGCLKG
jgi:ubiquitin carboxyl-terminal hydrolase 22/27/51